MEPFRSSKNGTITRVVLQQKRFSGTSVLSEKSCPFSLHVDVLESFKAYYMNLNCVIDKQESLEKTNTMFNDGTFATTEETFNEIITFPNRAGDANPVYLLTCF